MVGAVAVFVSIVGISSPAAAHEKRTVGPYALEVGWLAEPAYANTANAVFLEVVDAHTEAPVEHLEKTLQVEVIVGGAAARRTFDLAPIPQEPGHYDAQFIPTALGDYTFRVFGTIASTKVDERFESGPGRFDPVVSDATLQFPKVVTTSDEFAARMDRLQLLAIGSLLLALAGVVIATTALRMKQR